MAVDPVPKYQGVAALHPSMFAQTLSALVGDVRRRYTLRGTAAGQLLIVNCPWAGVIEDIRATQQVVGAGNAQNSATLVKAPVGSAIGAADVNLYTLATDGNTFLGNDAVGTEATAYPTAGTTAQTDGVSRVEFVKGDRLVLTVVGAQHGTVEYEIAIAMKSPYGLITHPGEGAHP